VATLLQANGTDLRSIMDVLGHSRLSTTADTYIHPTLDAQRRVADTLHRALFGAEPPHEREEPGQAGAAES
jgi:site-specific recombinase XerD